MPAEQLEALAIQHLKPPASPPDGDETRSSELQIEAFSEAVEEALLQHIRSTLKDQTQWEKSQPIALGSWARGELCPKSDLDLLFAGDEGAAAAVTQAAQEAGLKIRSRIPEDPADWTVGVETFDILALLTAKPLTTEARTSYELQLQKLKSRLKSMRRAFVASLKKERRARSERFDSIANYLEPNLKFGPGGLRDLGQALQLRALFPERFESTERAHALQVYEYYRRFFLLSRIRVQLGEGGGDLLSAHEQAGVAGWFGYSSPRDFMREIQKGLSRVSFYTDVDYEHALSSEKELAKYRAENVEEELEFAKLASMLERDPSTLVQAKARDLGFRLYRAAVKKGGAEKAKAQDALRRLVLKTVDPLQGDEVALALFCSRWIDLAVTDFKKIVGYVQHDQYHRYTVDAHLLQAVREMKRVAAKPMVLGKLAPIAKSLSKDDWKILGWAALYHDVGKGSGGDHSDKSVVIANEDLQKWDVPPETIREVIWLIENHLELSVAAFRGNPAHPRTWLALQAKGMADPAVDPGGKRLSRLAVFTAVDIRATNLEAYTPWKERLLAELVESLKRPEAQNLAKLEAALRGAKDSVRALLDRLDPFLVAAIPAQVLAKDLMSLGQIELGQDDSSITVKVAKIAKSNRVWVRFHTRQDKPGLFARMARALQANGLSVRHASVLSDDDLGVYDWFEVKPPRVLKGLDAKLLRSLEMRKAESSLENVGLENVGEIFDEIECLEMSEREWVVSFRGKDVRGALLSAAEALLAEGLSISWAKVHTWGRQIDDVFGVVPPKGALANGLSPDALVENLKKSVGRKARQS